MDHSLLHLHPVHAAALGAFAAVAVLRRPLVLALEEAIGRTVEDRLREPDVERGVEGLIARHVEERLGTVETTVGDFIAKLVDERLASAGAGRG